MGGYKLEDDVEPVDDVRNAARVARNAPAAARGSRGALPPQAGTGLARPLRGGRVTARRAEVDDSDSWLEAQSDDSDFEDL